VIGVSLSAKYDRRSLAWRFCAFFLMFVAAFALSFEPRALNTEIGNICAAIVLGLAAAWFGLRLIDRREALRVDQGGIFDRRFVDVAIPWSAIVSIKEVHPFGQLFFLIRLNRPITEFAMSLHKRLILRFNKLVWDADLHISSIATTVTGTDLRNALHANSQGPLRPDNANVRAFPRGAGDEGT
jgi:hypothetical protein